MTRTARRAEPFQSLRDIREDASAAACPLLPERGIVANLSDLFFDVTCAPIEALCVPVEHRFAGSCDRRRLRLAARQFGDEIVRYAQIVRLAEFLLQPLGPAQQPVGLA